MVKELGILLPTNHPSRFIDHFLPTLLHIRELAGSSRFLINFQPPWNIHQMCDVTKIMRDFGFDVEYVFTTGEKKPVRIGRIRQQCADLWPNAPYYLLVDDDFRFSEATDEHPKTSGARYLEVLSYMRSRPKCGAVICKGSGQNTGHKYKISQAYNGCWFYTGKGLFLRNLQPKFNYLPSCCHNLRGGLVDDYLPVLHRCALGFYPAQSFNHPTEHTATRLSFYGPEIWAMHSVHLIMREAGRHIREAFCPGWDLGNSNDEAKKRMERNPIRISTYIENDGEWLCRIPDWIPV